MRVVLALLALAGWARARHLLYRAALGERGGAGARRILGGRAAQPGEWGAACALLDRYWAVRCSGSVLAPRWALTAAHCATPRVAYVAWGAPPRPAAPVRLLYRHPGFRVEQRDEGRGPDVTALQHDVGLVHTRADMLLSAPPPRAPLAALAAPPAPRPGDVIDVLGYGAAEEEREGEGGGGAVLRSARLALTTCARSSWRDCVCGAGGARAVCGGDSGGPVLLRGELLALTSMGPAECAAGAGSAGGPGGALLSVFTLLAPYAALINDTIRDTEALQLAAPAAAPAAPALASLPPLTALAALILTGGGGARAL